MALPPREIYLVVHPGAPSPLGVCSQQAAQGVCSSLISLQTCLPNKASPSVTGKAITQTSMKCLQGWLGAKATRGAPLEIKH